MTDSPRIRNFRPDDRDAVLALRGRAFENHDAERERRRWAWQYEQNPWRDPARPEGLVLEQGGRVVGYFGLIPWRVCIDGREATAVAGTDYCIEPELQSQALGLLLARRFLELPDVEFAFATAPVPGSLPLWQYLGAQTVLGSAEPCLWVCTELGPGAAPATRPTDVTIEEVARFDGRFEELFAVCREHHRLLTVRDPAYLNWRHADYPFGTPRIRAVTGADGEVLGFSVLQADPAHSRAYLTELFCRAGETGAVQLLVEQARHDTHALGAGELYILHRDLETHEVLRGSPFQVVEGHPMGFLCRAPVAGPGVDDWYLTGADGDVLFHVGAS